jgi:hypothetical protein
MDNQREAGSLMPPTRLDTLTVAARAERVEQVRTLADDHDALAKEFHALHEQARAVYRQDKLSPAERRAQINALVRAESEVLAQAQSLRDTFQTSPEGTVPTSVVASAVWLNVRLRGPRFPRCCPVVPHQDR